MQIIFNRIVFILLVVLHSCIPMDTKPIISYTQHPLSQIQVLRKIPIWIDIKFNAEERVNIKAGIDEWVKALNGVIELDIVDNFFNMEANKIEKMYKKNGWLILKINERSELFYDTAGQITLGFVNDINGNVVYLVNRRVVTGNLKLILMHEIGHLLGLKHSGEYLMSAQFNYNDFICIDEETIQMVSDLYHINKIYLNYCIRDSNLSQKNKPYMNYCLHRYSTALK